MYQSESHNFNIYKASAGSGKTYTLVKEYICKLLSNPTPLSHRSLLAITFTNKASSEMKTRIILTLFEFSKGIDNINSSHKILYEQLQNELGYDNNTLQKKSKKALSEIIHHYSFFSVSTIDKFIYKVIRGFTYELNLPSNFEVEMDRNKIIEEGVLSLLDDVGVKNKLTDNLLAYSSYKTSQDKNWDIQEDLMRVSQQLFKDQKFIFINQLMNVNLIESSQKELLLNIKSFEKSLVFYQTSIRSLIKGIPETSFPYRALPVYLNKLSYPAKHDIQISSMRNSRIYNSLQTNIWYKKQAPLIDQNKIKNISSQLNVSLQSLVLLLSNNYSEYRFYKNCYNSLFLVSVLGGIDEKIEKIKQDNNIVHISEFNQIVFRFLQKNSVPFIYEKIGTKYRHYFIDEFQDTSVIQWKNIMPLVEEGLSTGGSCLIVGDGKQSIYRWRGGEVDQFLNLCDSHKAHTCSLNINYRSGKEIVCFNNEFFNFLSQKLTGSYNRLYNNLNQKTFLNKDGFLELTILNNSGLALDLETLQLTNTKIQSIVKDNYCYSDIVILTRNNKEITKIATYLTENGIPIISSESLLLKYSSTINFLLNNLHVLINESDFFSKANMLEYLISNKMIKNTRLNNHEIITTYSKTTNKDFQQFLINKGFNYDLEKLTNLNIYELIENLIRLFKLHVNNNIYITFFLDFVFEYSTSQNNSMKDFINYWNQKKDIASIVIPDGINAVEIMTIHKSKGLEFPIVIFPFANWKDDLGKDQMWCDVSKFFSNTNVDNNLITLLPLKKEIEDWPTPFPSLYIKHKDKLLLDNINLLYVAMTRSEDRLYVISNNDIKRGNISQLFLDFLNTNKSSEFKNDVFKSGQKLKKQLVNTNLSNVKLSKFTSTNWRSRIRIRKKHIINQQMKQNYAIVWGDLIHEIMAGVRVVDDVDIMLNKLNVARYYGQNVCEKIKKQITAIINNKMISHLYKKDLHVFSETSILSKDGEIHRPDRVVVHSKNEASLIDYKTGKIDDSHKYQMKKYHNLLVQLGFIKVNKYIVYLTTGQIVLL